jgi:SMC interacting uncharacterized protein involved in chromosome segregation
MEDVEKALTCLYLATEAHVAKDVGEKVHSAIAAKDAIIANLERDLVEAKANAGAWCQQAKENAMEIERLLSKIREVERDVERLRGHVSELRELAEFLSCETSGQYEARDEVMRKTKP